MLPDAQAAVRTVEEATGVSVLVMDEPSMRAMSSIRPAGKGAAAHVLKYNPKFAAIADYLIAFQCGCVLRLFQAPDASRYELGGTEQGRQTATRLLEEHLNKSGLNLPPQAATGLRDQIYDGLMLQLRSIPVGLRVDAWVRKEYGGLHAQQEEAARLQLAENQKVLSPKVKQLIPKTIYDASVGMNAAFAAFWSRVLKDPAIVVPFKVSGFLAFGENLLRLVDEVPDDPAEDRRLIDSWADQLGIAGWYKQIPFEA